MNNAIGSPLAARQNPFVYLILFYSAIIIAAIFVIFLLSKIIKKRHSTPEYIAKQKEIPTVYKNVVAVAKKFNLKKTEKDLLWKICKYTKAKNIFYNYSDSNFIDEIFKKYYQHKIRRNADSELLYSIFKLRFNIFKSLIFSRSLSNSQNIPAGTILSYLAPSGTLYQLRLIKNEKNGLYVTHPESLSDENKDKPENLSKIPLIFSLAKGQQYALTSRVVQYLTMPNGEKQILLSHSTALIQQSRRTTKRFVVNEKCAFAAVDSAEDKKKGLILTPHEKFYNGTIVDLSEGGCKLLSDLPIKKNQYIYLKFEIGEKGKRKKIVIFGQIKDTRTDIASGFYAIHIGFVKHSIETKIKLLASLYNYE